MKTHTACLLADHNIGAVSDRLSCRVELDTLRNAVLNFSPSLALVSENSLELMVSQAANEWRRLQLVYF